jgi:hypothetical protein
MIKRLAPALLFLISTPAWAQYCVVERSGAVHSVISADIDGANAKEIITETGPTYTAMTLDPAAKAKGYATRDKNNVGFFVYRSGYTATGKDWREAGSVASNEAGFAIDWPRFTLNGKAIASVQVELTLGDLHSGTVASTTRIDRKRDGVIFRLTDILENARGFADIVDGEDEFDWYDIQEAWAGAIEKRTDLQVEFRDKAANVTLATVTLRYLSPEVTQAELVKDVNALRAAYAAKKCDPPPVESFVIPGNNALVLVSDKPIGDLIYYVDENTIVRSKDNSGYDLVTVWTLAVNTKEKSTLIGKAAGRWSQHRFNCTTRRYWPDVRSAYLDAANRTYDPAVSSNRKAQTIYKFSVEDYEAQFVCGDLKVSGVRVSTADALRLARPPAAASPAPATVPPATAQKPPAPAATTPAPSAAQPAAKPKVWPKPDPRSHLGKGIALYRDLDFQPALVELLAATKADPTDARAFAFLSDTYRWLSVHDEEQKARQKALALDPNAFDALR